MKTVVAIALLSLAAGCVMKNEGSRSAATAPSARTARTAVEYAELRWELSRTTRAVTLEVPGDKFRGVWFEDALDHAGLTRPRPSNTPKCTSTDLLTMLSTQGWELVTHAIGQDAGDLHVEVWTLRRGAKQSAARSN